MTRTQAIFVLLDDERFNRPSHSSYKRALRACNALSLTDDDRSKVLMYLDYLDGDGEPYKWALTPRKRHAK